MKKYLLKLLIFFLPLIIIYIVLIFSVNGYSDSYYHKISSKKQNSLIIGSSRALQGLMPSVIDSILGTEIYNYSFNVAYSPYGRVYLESIKKKLSNNNHEVFLVTVDPWVISTVSDLPDEENTFRENGLMLNNIKSVSSYPNYEYIKKYVKVRNIITGILKENSLKSFTSYLHRDGWLELFIPMDSISVRKRTNNKLKTYRTNINTYKYSNTRLKYLEETISFLKDLGEVYLIRLPVHQKMLEIENEYMVNFDSIIAKISKDYNIDYINYTDDFSPYLFTDGNHLHKISSRKLSAKLAEEILKIREK